MNDEAKQVREFEPIFGGTRYIPMRYLGETDEIRRRFGEDGGFLIDYACGVVSFKQYLMKCDIQGNDDYNIELLLAVAGYYQEYATRLLEYLDTHLYYIKTDVECQLELFKKMLCQFKYEIAQLNLKGIDNL
jgi:hypothetical protein